MKVMKGGRVGEAFKRNGVSSLKITSLMAGAVRSETPDVGCPHLDLLWLLGDSRGLLDWRVHGMEFSPHHTRVHRTIQHGVRQ